MPLEPGSKLGHYEILSSLGAGGMGEVYRAKDSKLGREVAVKILLEEVSSDPERLARFEREARVLASLNHPSVATLHGFETERGTSFLVMELVEGETLADRIARGPIPVDEAVPLFEQIAEGLEAAHEKGVIHRDLKPANIKLGPDGASVKILDFGLAKAMATDVDTTDDMSRSMSPTLTLAATQRGEILGTAAYMSPEQASGKTVDERADLWAFGVCLYESLSGERLFQGEDAPNTLAAVLRDEPDLGSLPEAVPPGVRRLLGHCLAKSPKARLHHVADARLLLGEAEPQSREEIQETPRRRPIVLMVALGITTVALLALAIWTTTRPAPPGTSRLRVSIEIAEATDSGVASDVVLAPNGRHFVYVIRRDTKQASDLYVRYLDRLEGELLVSGTVQQPFLSPDGEWVAYFADAELRKISLAGGTPQTVAKATSFGNGSWLPDGTIVFHPADAPGGLLRISAEGGEPEVLTEILAGEDHHASAQLLPGGDALLFSAFSTWQGSQDPASPSSINLLSLATRERTTLLPKGAHARYLPTGHLVYLDGGTLFAVPFDLDQLAVVGTPRATDVRVYATPSFDRPSFSFSEAGDLLYVEGVAGESMPAVWLDRNGVETPGLEPGFYGNPQISPDGKQVALTRQLGGNVDIYVYDLKDGTGRRVTSQPGRDDDVVWSPDGESLIYNANEGGSSAIVRMRADGTGEKETLYVNTQGYTPYPVSVGPDGALLFGNGTAENHEDLFILLAPGGDPIPFANSPAAEGWGAFSPDGRWIAYASTESGVWEVYVRPYPLGPGIERVSTSGGYHPRWSADGTEIFYSSGSALYAVEVNTSGGQLARETPVRLFDGYQLPAAVLGEEYIGFDVTSDSQRFLVTPASPGHWGNDHVRLVTDFFEELQRPSMGSR
jgi:serine/threonine-protein kinase